MLGRFLQILPPLFFLSFFRVAAAQQLPSPNFSKILFSRATTLKKNWEKNFTLPQPGHVIAHLQISSDTDWEDPKLPAALLEVTVDERLASHLVTFMGRAKAGHPYAVHLGFLTAGPHELALQRADSADASVKLHHARLDVYYANHAFYPVLAHAPIIFGRSRRHSKTADAHGSWLDPDMRFSDVPLLMAYEKRELPSGHELKYTIFFSNENGGTPPPGLLHLWGRYTDIEWAYRVELESNGQRRHDFFQGRNHQEFSYLGGFENEQPLLQVATLNNMFSDSLTTPRRFALPPVFAIPPDGLRESVMLDAPWTWRVSAKEARREQRLNPHPTDTTRIADLRRYLFIQFIAEPETLGTEAGGYFVAKFKNDPNEYASNLGHARLIIRSDKTMARQTAIPLPSGMEADALQSLEFVADPQGASVILKNVARLFTLGSDDQPRLWKENWRGLLRLTAGQRAVILENQ
ncbi:MAG: hypothetical protein ONB46_03590 [candidate division KSB1 bacterium]|nr:hypothetical protein [candidate division KSB1 bacterium]MDZ7364997.1 hypothetical protein [candidate division KSB1 bacterium]MDZ7403392.1 hypothetical protein [candidate division KSB1 bacterium]